MTAPEARSAVIRRLVEKADRSLDSAQSVLQSGDAELATNRVYYACFYVVSAVLLDRRLQFARHSGVRSALHQHLVRTDVIPPEAGRFFDTAFSERQEADYNALSTFDPDTVAARIAEARRFVDLLKGLLSR